MAGKAKQLVWAIAVRKELPYFDDEHPRCRRYL